MPETNLKPQQDQLEQLDGLTGAATKVAETTEQAVLDTDDFSQQYLEDRQSLQDQNAGNELLQRVQAQREQELGQQRNETNRQYTNAERQEFAQFSDEQLQNGATQEEADAYDGPPISSDSSYRPDIRDPFMRARAESRARSRYPGGPGAFMRDAGRTIIDAPGAVVSGGINAVNETLNATASADEWISSHIGTLILGFDNPETGEKALIKALGPEEYRKLKDKDPSFGTVGNIPKPDWVKPDSKGGKMIEGISQFLVGFYGASKLPGLKGLQPTTKVGQFAKAATQGAIADFTVFDPHQARLSNLIQEHPALANPVNEFLAADPNDSEAEGRFKNALEGLGLGALAEGFFRSVGAIRRGIIAKRAASDEARIAGATEEIRPEVSDDAFKDLGDPNAPPVQKVYEDGTRQTQAGVDLEQRIRNEPEAVVAEYNARPDAMGGKVLNTDIARELSPEYLADRPRSADVHEEASQFIKDQYAKKLKEAPKDGEEPLVVFTAGGTGAGKTTAVNSVESGMLDAAQIVYDTNMNSLKSAQTKIDQALEAGKDVKIVYVYRDPVEALVNGALPRAERQAKNFGSGRTVPIEEHLKTHQGSRETIEKLQEIYKGEEGVTFQIIDNSLGKGKAVETTLDKLRVNDYNNLADDLNTALEEAYGKGQISKETYQGFKGRPSGSQAADQAAQSQAVKGSGGRTQQGGDQLKPLPTGLNDSELAQASKGIAQAVEPDTYINFARIDTPDDVKNVMQQMADAYKKDVDKARRGDRRTFAQMELDAKQVDAWETLAARRTGEPFNSEQALAARNLWATSADTLTKIAKKAAETGSEADLFAFRKQMATHRAIQNEVIAARTETARALASWRIPVGSNAEKFAQVDLALKQNGGTGVAREMAARIQKLADAGMIQEMDEVIRRGAFAKTRDAFLEAWINGLLSGPKTHLVNAMSNTTVIFQQMYERKVASQIASFLGDDASVQMGETMAQYSGMMNGLRDAIRYAKQSFMTGESGYGLGKVELPTQNAISSEALEIASDALVGRTVDVLGSVVNVPGRSLQAADEFFKTVGYRMELNALALRKATQEVNSGLVKPEELKSRIADIIDNPPTDIKLEAIDAATYQTFTNTPGALAQAIQKAKGQYPGLNIILPFVRTPANIMNYTFQRTPLAPLFKQFRSDIAAGGARRDLALSRMATGTTIMLVVADMAMSGNITGKGPSNTAERQALQRTGWQQYSVKVGDRYYAYNRMDPLGATIGLAADMVDIMANDQYGVDKEKNMEEMTVAMAMSIANNAMSKTYLSGLSDFMEAVSDPERYGESYFQRLAGSAVPTGVAEVARGVDPYMRETQNMVEAMMKRTPGLSDNLPPRRDLWGDVITYKSGLGVLYDAFSPIYSKAEKPSPIDEEILRNEMNVSMPNAKTSINGASVNLDRYEGAYSRFVQLAGNDLKHPAWNLGARDLLNEIVTGKHPLSEVYNIKSDGPDGGKYFFVRDIMEQYRDLAKRQLLEEYPQIKDEIEEKNRHKLEMKMPVFNQ